VHFRNSFAEAAADRSRRDSTTRKEEAWRGGGG